MVDIVNIKQIINLNERATQKKFADLIDVSEAAVSDLVKRGVILKDHPLGEWLHRYCSHIREQAAGRATTGGLDLATERAALAREQTIRIELQNAISRREYAPIDAMESGLADLMSRIAKQFDSIPGKLRVKSDKLTADDLDVVSGVIASIRNEMAGWNIDWFSDGGIGDVEEIDESTLE